MLRSINLHLHDLRREFARRLLESGADQHDVRDFLGHANITTTSRYLATPPVRLERALSRMEGSDSGDANKNSDGRSIRTPFAQSDRRTDEPAPQHPDKSVN